MIVEGPPTGAPYGYPVTTGDVEYNEYLIAVGIPTVEEMMATICDRPYSVWYRPTFEEWKQKVLK
jgi:hypothetical protein